MARRITKAQFSTLGTLLILGLIVGGIVKVFEAIGLVAPLVLVVIVIIGVAWYKYTKHQKRLKYLREKYQDEELVQRIAEGYFWQGQTAEQVIDSIGNPVDVDKKMLKTKKKEVWKYNHRGANRYGLRITLENSIVVEWDKKAS